MTSDGPTTSHLIRSPWIARVYKLEARPDLASVASTDTDRETFPLFDVIRCPDSVQYFTSLPPIKQIHFRPSVWEKHGETSFPASRINTISSGRRNFNFSNLYLVEWRDILIIVEANCASLEINHVITSARLESNGNGAYANWKRDNYAGGGAGVAITDHGRFRIVSREHDTPRNHTARRQECEWKNKTKRRFFPLYDYLFLIS